jgi:hypothetical protein
MNKNVLYLFAILMTALVSFSLMSGSCNNDNPITPPITTVDSNIVIKKSMVVDETFGPTSLSGIDFYDTTVVTSDDFLKDAKFIDSVGEGTRYNIRSGDLGKLNFRVPGFLTKFWPMYDSMTYQQFDTLSKIFYYSTIDTTDFVLTSTYYHPYNLTVKPVYGIYLSGRKPSFNQGRIVYGMFMIDSLYKTNDNVEHARLYIKLNKNGQDQFNPNHSK